MALNLLSSSHLKRRGSDLEYTRSLSHETVQRGAISLECHAITVGRRSANVDGAVMSRARKSNILRKMQNTLLLTESRHCTKRQLLCVAPQRSYQGFRADLPTKATLNPSVEHRTEVCKELRDAGVALQSVARSRAHSRCLTSYRLPSGYLVNQPT